MVIHNSGMEYVATILHTTIFYRAGECLPLLGPFGCLAQLPAVKPESEEYFVPQYLHTYWDFSEPSYSLCFPLCGPLGCLEQLPAVKPETEEDFAPQYSQ